MCESVYGLRVGSTRGYFTFPSGIERQTTRRDVEPADPQIQYTVGPVPPRSCSLAGPIS